MHKARRRGAWLLFVLLLAGAAAPAFAQTITIPAFNFVQPAQTPREVSLSLQLLVLLTVLSVGPSLLIMTTCFTRIIIVFSFLRQALGTRTLPPNQLLVGLALFLTAFIMRPVWQEMDEQAFRPYLNGTMTQQEAFNRSLAPLRTFMLNHTREKDLGLFMSIAKIPTPKTPAELSMGVITPAFIISELKTAFIIGFIIYIPFLIIDMVVASVTMSMGMMMLPPAMIAMPFKLLMFVLVDGWYLLVKSLVGSFYQ
ncbi:MAG: flagellar type III secretion system pore protein FliP [Candidatus Omnitrophica bacterium]|nr:flagellar type III secretion system pore protein FliP [Candidatus Omnitrophota bacterium]